MPPVSSNPDKAPLLPTHNNDSATSMSPGLNDSNVYPHSYAAYSTDSHAAVSPEEPASPSATAASAPGNPYKKYMLLVSFGLVVLVGVSFIGYAFLPRSGYPDSSLSVSEAAVATEHPTCSHTARRVLEEGGSVVDAAIAASFCIGVVHNFASGIGGGGFMLVHDVEHSSIGPDDTPLPYSSHLYDFREMAPALAHRDMYVGDMDKAKYGGLAVAVPGEVRGMHLAWTKHGRLPWARLVYPSFELAFHGFEVNDLLARRLLQVEQLVLTDPLWAESYLVDGRLARTGDTIRRRLLADTLNAILVDPEAFYTGPIAESTIEAIRSTGGILTSEDLVGYAPLIRMPISLDINKKRFITSGSPTSGPALLHMLNILAGYTQFPAHKTYDPVLEHRLVEAMKFGFAERTYLGDPSYLNKHDGSDPRLPPYDPELDQDLVTARLIDPAYAKETREKIDDGKTFPPDYYGGNYGVSEAPGTTHITVVDRSGNAASITSTVNIAWGSRIITPSGILLNNQMDDFSTPNTTNHYGLRDSPANYIAPGKRPLSSSVPLVVLDRLEDNRFETRFVLGGSGGSRILSGALNVVLNHIVRGLNLMDAIMMPRLHHQLYPNEVEAEYNYPKSIMSHMHKYMGHEYWYRAKNDTVSVIQAISRVVTTPPATGAAGARETTTPSVTLTAVSDPRKEGLPDGY
ncbi:gamma-glutamyltransferase [Fonticula alba]|uniref:Gamma-glutamyltransferase n=1 Tax=Fonticula alba TaxID=691883 RepID=A0A058Z396_FONAL|nr:gamma-glutamyltransferase [Fonticula alba]KCV68596.1 gamma-glutamyltransferase [Fonticula alba]|eukprot:XP_009497028.1 gamma-glutamyltransferase [Fonticula alba]